MRIFFTDSPTTETARPETAIMFKQFAILNVQSSKTTPIIMSDAANY